MSNKFFNVNNRNQIVTIVEDKGKFYELSDGNMIKKDTFMQKYQPVLDDINEKVNAPTETPGNSTSTSLDPDEFFNVKSVPDDVIQGVKQADPSKGLTDDSVNRTEVVHKSPGDVENKSTSAVNESLVKQIPEDEVVIPNNTNTDVSQYKVYDNDDEAYADFEKKNREQQPKPQQPQVSDIEQKKMEIELLFDDEKMALGEEEAITRRNKRLAKLPTEAKQQEKPSTDLADNLQPKPQPADMSPIEMMFSTFKRKHDITIHVEFNDKIGDPDFVKLMVENMDGDIVGYYKNLIMNNIMKDLSKIEEAVEREIQLEIFGDVVKEKPTKTTDKTELIPGGKTKTGKQKYKYVDSDGNIKELLPETAKTKGYEPYKKG
jgi:hypothetical protein